MTTSTSPVLAAGRQGNPSDQPNPTAPHEMTTGVVGDHGVPHSMLGLPEEIYEASRSFAASPN